MASFLHILLFFSISLSTSQRISESLTLPIKKDDGTLQYITHIHQGTPTSAKKLVVDLGGPFLWMDCDLSSSYKPAPCRSIQCSTANGANTCGTSPSSTCGLLAKNTINGITVNGQVGEDIITIGIVSTSHFLFSCAPASLLQGLSSGAKGMVGLGRNRISLPSQLAGDGKFSICLPSSTDSSGAIIFNTNPCGRRSMPHNLAELSKSLMYTPLISNPKKVDADEYSIGVKSIKINGGELSFNASLLSINQQGIGGTRLSTTVPYTTLETSIYNAVAKAFTQVGTSLFNMTRVAPVAPFEVCFDSRNIARTRVGAVVPSIELVLQSNMVKWRIHGANSMVQVSDEVMCLGFLDGGLNATSSVVIGGHQLENNLLEFDLASSRMGFGSLLKKQIDCSDFNFLVESS